MSFKFIPRIPGKPMFIFDTDMRFEHEPGIMQKPKESVFPCPTRMLPSTIGIGGEGPAAIIFSLSDKTV